MQITHSFPSLTQLVESLNYRKCLASLTKNTKWKIKFLSFFLFFLYEGWEGFKQQIFLTFFPSPKLWRETEDENVLRLQPLTPAAGFINPCSETVVSRPSSWSPGCSTQGSPGETEQVRGLKRSRTSERRQVNARPRRASNSNLKTSTHLILLVIIVPDNLCSTVP